MAQESAGRCTGEDGVMFHLIPYYHCGHLALERCGDDVRVYICGVCGVREVVDSCKEPKGFEAGEPIETCNVFEAAQISKQLTERAKREVA